MKETDAINLLQPLIWTANIWHVFEPTTSA